jgi:hypothetical protein
MDWIRVFSNEDRPMLELLKGFHGSTIHLPTKRTWRPDPERLSARYERFLAAI